MRKILFVLAAIVGFTGFAKAEFKGGGNTARFRNIAISTTSKVLISTDAANAYDSLTATNSLKISEWSFREIVNVSTCCNLALYISSDAAVYSSSASAVLGWDISGKGLGDTYVIPDQDVRFGLWESPADGVSGNAGQGAVITESYFSSIKRR